MRGKINPKCREKKLFTIVSRLCTHNDDEIMKTSKKKEILKNYIYIFFISVDRKKKMFYGNHRMLAKTLGNNLKFQILFRVC